MLTAFIIAVRRNRDLRGIALLTIWNAWPGSLAVGVAYLMGVGFDIRRGVVTGLVGAAVQCAVLVVCYGPLFHVTAGAPLAGGLFVPPAAFVLSGVVMLFAGVAIYAIPIRVPAGCPTCGYDLAGLGAGAACPECGRKAVA